MVAHTSALLALLGAASLAAANPMEKRACPNVHVFGARETTVAQGYGTSGPVVNSILAVYSGSTSEAIVYPACGGQASCGSISYANSVVQGVAAVASQVNSFNTQCPSTVLVLVGYSQGGQIFDDGYCGGGDTNEGISNTAIPISAAAQAKIAAAIFMGDPRHIPGLSYNVGTCQASGVSLYLSLLPHESGVSNLTEAIHLFRSITYSLHPVQQASCAPTHPRSSHTAMPPTPTAAMAPTPPPTKATQPNTAPSHSPSSRARSTLRSRAPAAAALWLAVPLPALLLAVAAPAAHRLSTDNVVAFNGLAALLAPPGRPANIATPVCISLRPLALLDLF